ncbi:MAG: ROK family protein [Elusimicrobia bacterium]|nr:ROK family protein [Elusimicrobiota bacterium]
MSKYYLGIDLGGTEVKIGIVDELGKTIEEASIVKTSAFKPEELVKKIVEKTKSMKNFRFVSGTGVGVAGDIDQENGIVRFSPNLPKWKNVNLRQMLKKHLLGPIVIDNDANAAALGAYFLDAKMKVKNLVCVTLGTGVGGGIILNGKVFRGATGTAGEIGHMHYDADGHQCNCGSFGCIERYLGAAYLSYEGKISGSKKIFELAHDNAENITPKILEEAARSGDSAAEQIWLDAGTKLGVILADVINLLNPEMIVLTGGVSKANELLLDPIKEIIKKRAFKTPARACKIVISKYNSMLGVVGAALFAKE